MPTTTAPPVGELAPFLGGFFAGEGYLRAGDRGFDCTVALGARDAVMCELFRDVLGVGRVRRYQRRAAHHDDVVVWVVRSPRELVEVVVPFLDEHLPRSHKREQYLAWRSQLLDHWQHRARRMRTCTVEGCDQPRRAKRLCRRHYYAAYGR